jgi:hypothetical protein
MAPHLSASSIALVSSKPTGCATRLTLVKEKRIGKALINGTKTVGKGVYFSGDMLIFQKEM